MNLRKTKKLIINCNDSFALYTFRLNLIKELMKDYDVYVIAKYDSYTSLLNNEGIEVITVDIDSANTSFLKDLKLIRTYKRLFKKIKADIIINYTVKAHIFGSLASLKKTKIINFVSGVGTVFQTRNLRFKIVRLLYSLISKKVDHYVFLNTDDYFLFKDLNLVANQCSFLNSEGVILENFYPYVNFKKEITFIFIGRLIKEKGIYEYLEAASMIKEKYKEVRFLVAGEFYNKKTCIKKSVIDEFVKRGIIEYLGYRDDIAYLLRDVHVVVLPSYREGMSISLIEALASKKVIIGTNVPGIKDIIIDNYNGYQCVKNNVESLASKIEKYILEPNKEELHNNAYLSSKKYNQLEIIKAMKSVVDNL